MIRNLINAGWLVLASLVFTASLDYVAWYQKYSEAELGLAMKEAEIEYRYLRMAEFRFKLEFPTKEDESA